MRSGLDGIVIVPRACVIVIGYEAEASGDGLELLISDDAERFSQPAKTNVARAAVINTVFMFFIVFICFSKKK